MTTPWSAGPGWAPPTSAQGCRSSIGTPSPTRGRQEPASRATPLSTCCRPHPQSLPAGSQAVQGQEEEGGRPLASPPSAHRELSCRGTRGPVSGSEGLRGSRGRGPKPEESPRVPSMSAVVCHKQLGLRQEAPGLSLSVASVNGQRVPFALPSRELRVGGTRRKSSAKANPGRRQQALAGRSVTQPRRHTGEGVHLCSFAPRRGRSYSAPTASQGRQSVKATDRLRDGPAQEPGEPRGVGFSVHVLLSGRGRGLPPTRQLYGTWAVF
ncbi:unnamed protein product [Rangifer tarandus platyrhynchus]|uniref:Uncharacterized protein n=2 Tax=Rangifer tarandus platyrhynchus TaxID=3082113 RepID=A0ABN8YEQ7_RANTA|nr:unnamed protein product [Rangifer tarandus platyrhynchus]CAI9700292.1 unnamed protein product [Rangifer tarandus platyrhynchus]